MMNTIIVPTDFSLNAENAIRYAIQLARQRNIKIVYAHIYSTPIITSEAGLVYVDSLSESIKQKAERTLSENIDKIYNSLGMNRNLLLSEFEVVEALTISSGLEKIIKKYKADIVIMGTHGATGLKKIFLGSNAVDVIENIDIPVLTVPGNSSYNNFSSIAYASDFKDIDTEMGAVIDFAKLFEANLNVIHIDYSKSIKDFDNISPILQKWQKQKDYDKINFHFLQSGKDSKPAEQLRSILENINTDLLIMFHKHRSFG